VHNTEERFDHDSVVHLLEPTQQQRHRQRAYYLANVEMIDAKVGQIFEALEKNGYLEDAVVIYTSDHGDCLTDHGHGQITNYELRITKGRRRGIASGRGTGPSVVFLNFVIRNF
jgi:arylsulfatase A-like enzyme